MGWSEDYKRGALHEFILRAFWRDLTRENPLVSDRWLLRLDELIKDGWITMPSLEDLLVSSALTATAMQPVRQVLAVFDIQTASMGFTPKPRQNEVGMFDCISAAQAAYLFIELEALGLPIDPLPLVGKVRDALGKQAMLTRQELRVWWYPQERGRGVQKVWCEPHAGDVTLRKFVTAAGFKIEALEAGGVVFEWSSTGPRPRRRAA